MMKPTAALAAIALVMTGIMIIKIWQFSACRADGLSIITCAAIIGR